jgi:hypothetical protein
MTPARTTLIVLVYSDSAAADRALRGTARRLEAAGCRLAGVVQRDDGRYDRAVCDMSLEELSSGETIPISRGRGRMHAAAALTWARCSGRCNWSRPRLSSGPMSSS